MIIQNKSCLRCGKTLPKGRRKWCRDICSRLAYFKRRYHSDPEFRKKQRAFQKAWSVKNRDKILEYRNKWLAKPGNREKLRERANRKNKQKLESWNALSYEEQVANMMELTNDIMGEENEEV